MHECEEASVLTLSIAYSKTIYENAECKRDEAQTSTAAREVQAYDVSRLQCYQVMMKEDCQGRQVSVNFLLPRSGLGADSICGR